MQKEEKLGFAVRRCSSTLLSWPFNLCCLSTWENEATLRTLYLWGYWKIQSLWWLFLGTNMGLWEAMAPFLTLGLDLFSHITVERLQCWYAHQALTGCFTLCLLKLSLKCVHTHSAVLYKYYSFFWVIALHVAVGDLVMAFSMLPLPFPLKSSFTVCHGSPAFNSSLWKYGDTNPHPDDSRLFKMKIGVTVEFAPLNQTFQKPRDEAVIIVPGR